VIDGDEQLVGCLVVWLSGCLAVQLTRIDQGLPMPKAGRVAFYRTARASLVSWPARWVAAMAGARCVPSTLPIPPPRPPTRQTRTVGRLLLSFPRKRASEATCHLYLIPFSV
jgi:hypothetical protein